MSVTSRESNYPFLPEPIPVAKQQWSDEVLPLVSVSCLTYMHESFIRDAIEGFLMQQTRFKIEILIQDDNSTDETAEIVREYEMKFPQLIKPTYQIENQFQKNPKTAKYIKPPERKGKYIAFCEGDDYWTSPFKLQKQVDFLEANEGFAICHHNMQVICEENTKEPHLSNSPDQKEVTTIEDLAHGNYIYTASCLCRNGLFGKTPEWLAKCPVGDYPTHMLNAQFGKIKYIPEVMGVYRVHKDGFWECKDEIYRIGKWIDLIDHMKNHFSPGINKILIETQSRNAEYLMIKLKDQPDRCKYYANKLIENNPLYLANLKSENALLKDKIGVKNKELNRQNDKMNHMNNEISQKEEELFRKNELLNQGTNELLQIKNSLAYKLSSALLRTGFTKYPLMLLFKLKKK